MADPRVTSLNHRLRNAAEASGLAPERVRNRLVFQRILARLSADERWVLKGGFALEIRLGLDARATKDLDVLRWGDANLSAMTLQDLLDEALDVDLGDGFTFVVRVPKPVRVEDVLPDTWRVVVDAYAHGSRFAEAVMDVITRAEAPVEAPEVMLVPAILDEPPVHIAVVDIHRQAAEKFHAYTRLYAHERPSSRVKDLVDLALLIETELLETGPLGRALRGVFAERDDAPPPTELPQPPGEWVAPFARLADDTSLPPMTSTDAWRLTSDLYTRALNHQEEP